MVSTITRTGTGAQDLCLVNCSGIPGLEISQEEELSPVAPLCDKSSPTLVRYQKWACAGLHLHKKKKKRLTKGQRKRKKGGRMQYRCRDLGTAEPRPGAGGH